MRVKKVIFITMIVRINKFLKTIIIALTVIINVKGYLFCVDLKGMYFLKGINESYIALLELSSEKTYFVEWKNPRGFVFIDSIKVKKGNIGNGIYYFTQRNDKLMLKNYYPRDIVSKTIMIETDFRKRSKYPAIYLNTKNLVTFLEFLQNCNNTLLIVDTIKIVDNDTYNEKLNYWKKFLKEFVKYCYGREPEKSREIYSKYYRDSANRDLAFKQNKLEIEKLSVNWQDIMCDSVKVFQTGNFAYMFAKFKIITDKVIKSLNSYYILLPENGKWKIIYEEEKVTSLTMISKLLEDFVKKWLDSWMRLDIDSYKRFYDKLFETSEFDYKKWIDYKMNIFSKLSWVDIEVENLVILSEDEYLWRVEFLQYYKSDRSSDIGYKILYIKGTPGEFKIVKELWIPVKKN